MGMGVVAATREESPCVVRGPRGHRGAKGPPGPTGQTGPPGPPLAASFAYASCIFHRNTSIGEAQIDLIPDAPLPFPAFVGQNVTSQYTGLVVERAGWYQVSYGLGGKAFPAAFRVSVTRNGRVVGALQGSVAISGSFIVTAQAGDLFEMYTDAYYLRGEDSDTAYSLSIVQLA